MPPRRHRRRGARRLQRHRRRHLGRRRALAGREGDRPRGRAPRRALHAPGEQPHPRLHRRPARADRRRAARCATPHRDPRAPRRRHGRRVGRLHDRLRGAPVPRRSDGVARRCLRGRRVRRPRPARQPRRAPAREDHRRRATRSRSTTPGSDSRPELQAWSTYGNTRGLHDRPDRVDDGSGDPEERGLLRPDPARRTAGLRAEPAAGQAGERGHAPSRRRRRRGDRGRDAARAPRQGRAADLQDRHPHDHRRRSIRGPGAKFTDHSAEVYAGWCNAAKGMDAWGALNASFGNLWKATAEINESLFPHIAVEPRLPHRLRRRGRVARYLRQSLREGSRRSTRPSTRTSSA